MTRVYFIGFPASGPAGVKKDSFAEGEYHDDSGHMVRGPVSASKGKTARALGKGFLAGEEDAVVSIDVVGGGGVGTVVFEPIHAEEDGGETFGLFGTRAAAAAVSAKAKATAAGGGGGGGTSGDGDGGDGDGGDGDGEFTIWEIREHVVQAA